MNDNFVRDMVAALAEIESVEIRIINPFYRSPDKQKRGVEWWRDCPKQTAPCKDVTCDRRCKLLSEDE